MSARERVPRRGVSGRTHRSAPTRWGKRSGDNGNWHGKRTFPLRGGTEPAPLQKNGSKLAHGGVRLGCGFRQPNSETEFGASVKGTPPYEATQVRLSNGPMRSSAPTEGIGGPTGHPDQRRAAKRPRRGREGWVGIGAEIIPKISSNPGQSLSHGCAVPAPFAQGSLGAENFRRRSRFAARRTAGITDRRG